MHWTGYSSRSGRYREVRVPEQRSEARTFKISTLYDKLGTIEGLGYVLKIYSKNMEKKVIYSNTVH